MKELRDVTISVRLIYKVERVVFLGLWASVQVNKYRKEVSNRLLPNTWRNMMLLQTGGDIPTARKWWKPETFRFFFSMHQIRSRSYRSVAVVYRAALRCL
jgi:hypothetical protein